ncbi:uncharacterized protein [Triticum aestivum]|uniref:uncharacterized protein n=1 Tax=Triticum aestivum TaxID=4565 RepID=UPI001D025482|nr:uncharacterized protein LOC123149749 [Triticum aestivum]
MPSPLSGVNSFVDAASGSRSLHAPVADGKHQPPPLLLPVDHVGEDADAGQAAWMLEEHLSQESVNDRADGPWKSGEQIESDGDFEVQSKLATMEGVGDYDPDDHFVVADDDTNEGEAGSCCESAHNWETVRCVEDDAEVRSGKRPRIN